MQYYRFQHIFDEFSKQKEATKANDHDIGKVREKFTEIVDVVGINIDLLRKHKDENTGKMISFDNSNRSFCFPETICDFCISILKKYTDSDFKLLRKGQYKEVSINTLDFLIDGFTDYLKDLGYDYDTIISEKFKMRKRMQYDTSKQLFQLREECQGLLKDAEDYNSSILDSLYEDKIFFTFYMVKKLRKLRDYIASVHENFTEIRINEVDEFAGKAALNVNTSETMLDIQQTLILTDALEHDKNYQTLFKKQMDILCTQDFIKKLKTSYKKNNDQLKTIKEQHECRLFGDKIQQVFPTYNFTPVHPFTILYEAIIYTDETEQDKEKEANITEEQHEKQIRELSKIYSQLFPIPESEHVEQLIKKKGIIKFPCCTEEEIVVCINATGYIVNKCPRCNKQVLFNLDDMTAKIYETPKGHMNPI